MTAHHRTITAAAIVGVVLALSAPTAAAKPGITAPADYAAAVTSAPLTLCARDVVDRELVAAQLRGASGFNRLAVSAGGAQGPAQLTPAMFAVYGADDDHNGTASPFDIVDAVSALVRLDCTVATRLHERGTVVDREAVTAGYLGGVDNVDDPNVRAMAREVLR